MKLSHVDDDAMYVPIGLYNMKSEKQFLNTLSMSCAEKNKNKTKYSHRVVFILVNKIRYPSSCTY